MEKELNLNEKINIYNSNEIYERLKVRKAITRYGSEVHILKGSTSWCGLWTGFGITSRELTCEKCIDILNKKIVRIMERKK